MKVDIIIPSYHGDYLEQTLDSCFKQTYKDYLVTVVDNDSPKNIKAICDRFPGVNYIKAPGNLGPAGGRNYGIDRTKGDLISFIDDDDIMDQNKLFYSVREFEKNPRVGLTCGNYQILVNGKIRAPFYKRAIHIDHKALMKQNYVASGSTTIRRDIYNKIGGFNEKYWIAEDLDYWLRISEVSEIKYLHKVLYFYRIVPGSQSLTQRSDIQKKHISNLEEIRKSSLQRIKNGENI